MHRKVKNEVVTVENNNNPKKIRAQSEYRAFKTSPLRVQPDSNSEFEPQPIYEEEIEDNFQDVESNLDFEDNKQIDFEENKESYLEENKKVYLEDKDLTGIDPELEFVKELTDFTEFDQKDLSLKQEGQKKHFVENLEQKVSNQQLYFNFEEKEKNSIFEDIPVSSSPVKIIQDFSLNQEGQNRGFVENSDQQLDFDEKEENNSIFEDFPVLSSPVKTIQEPDTESLTSFYSVNSEEPEDNTKRKVKFGRSYEDLINELVAEQEQTMSPSRLLENQ